MEDFKKLFELAEASSFLKGQNQRNWSATFDWLITDANMAKVLDGNYSDKGSRSSNEPTRAETAPDYVNRYNSLPTSPEDPFQ